MHICKCKRKQFSYALPVLGVRPPAALGRPHTTRTRPHTTRPRPQHRRSARLWPGHMRRRHLRLHPGHDAHGRGVEFTFDKVGGCMRSLKSNPAAGCDGNLADLLEYSGGTGVQALTHLSNAVLANRCVLSAWRQGIVLVLHLAWGRTGDTGACCNYRPVLLLPVVDKLFAKIYY